MHSQPYMFKIVNNVSCIVVITIRYDEKQICGNFFPSFLILFGTNFCFCCRSFFKTFFFNSDSTFSWGSHTSILKIVLFGNHFRFRATVGHEFISLFDPCDHTWWGCWWRVCSNGWPLKKKSLIIKKGRPSWIKKSTPNQQMFQGTVNIVSNLLVIWQKYKFLVYFWPFGLRNKAERPKIAFLWRLWLKL